MTETTPEAQSARSGALRFSKRVRELRKSQGWTQSDLAKRMTAAGYPMHLTTIAKLEAATRPTPVEEAYALAAIFELPVTELLTSADDSDRVTLEEVMQHFEELVKQTAEVNIRLRHLGDVDGVEDTVREVLGDGDDAER